MSEETKTTETIPTPSAPTPKAPKAPAPRTVTLKKFARSGEPETTITHTLSDFVEEFTDIQNPNDARLTPAQKAAVEQNGVVTIKAQKPVTFARDNGYTASDGTPIVSEYTSEYTEDVCPKCGYDLDITLTGTDDKSRGVKCLSCGNVWKP